MADIAFIFHWQPETLMAMRAGQIMTWQRLAARRWAQAYSGDS